MFDDTRTSSLRGCLSPLVLDQWYAGELDDARTSECEAHLRECPTCAARRAEMEASAAAFLARYPAPRLKPLNMNATTPAPGASAAPSGPRPAPTPRNGRLVPLVSRTVWGAGAFLAVAASLIVWLRVSPSHVGAPQLPAPLPTLTRSKGNAHVSFFVKRDGRVLPGHSGMVTHPGDQVRFSALVNTPQFLAVLSRDSAGVVSVYHRDAAALEPTTASNGVALQSSVELDDVLGEENVWAIFCDAAVPVDALEQEVRVTGSLTPPMGCTSDELTWRKERR